MNSLISNNCSEIKNNFIDKLCNTHIFQIVWYNIYALSFKWDEVYITINIKLIYKDKWFEKIDMPINLIMTKEDNKWIIKKSDSLTERYSKYNK